MLELCQHHHWPFVALLVVLVVLLLGCLVGVRRHYSPYRLWHLTVQVR